jgi:hypothetical protein
MTIRHALRRLRLDGTVTFIALGVLALGLGVSVARGSAAVGAHRCARDQRSRPDRRDGSVPMGRFAYLLTPPPRFIFKNLGELVTVTLSGRAAGLARSLRAKLEATEAAFGRGQREVADRVLAAYEHQVRALVQSVPLDPTMRFMVRSSNRGGQPSRGRLGWRARTGSNLGSTGVAHSRPLRSSSARSNHVSTSSCAPRPRWMSITFKGEMSRSRERSSSSPCRWTRGACRSRR